MIKKIYCVISIVTATSLLLFYFSSCKKKDNKVNFTGKVINPGTNEGVSDAAVSLSSTSVESWVYNSNFQDIANMNSGQDGSFAFNFDEKVASAYRIYIYKNNYFSNTTIINANEVTTESGYNSTFELLPEATITLRVKNSLPLDSADRILFNIAKGAVSCPNGCPDNYIEGMGTVYDTTITCKTYGNRYFLVESNITRGANTTQRKDSVYLNPFVTTELNIFY